MCAALCCVFICLFACILQNSIVRWLVLRTHSTYYVDSVHYVCLGRFVSNMQFQFNIYLLRCRSFFLFLPFISRHCVPCIYTIHYYVHRVIYDSDNRFNTPIAVAQYKKSTNLLKRRARIDSSKRFSFLLVRFFFVFFSFLCLRFQL